MRGLKRLKIFMGIVLICTSCVTKAPVDDVAPGPAENLAALDAKDSTLEADAKVGTTASAEKAKPQDDFAQFEETQPKAEDDFANFEEPKKETPKSEEKVQAEPVPQVTPPEPVIQAEVPKPVESVPQPEKQLEVVTEAPVTPVNQPIAIKSIQFKGNDNGGTVIIGASGPMSYSTRMDTSSGQMIIDIPNSILPRKLRRPLITKDFTGVIGSIDAYQNPGSNVSRIIVHLHAGATEPVVQTEENSLLVIASEQRSEQKMGDSVTKAQGEEGVKLLSYDSLESFLSGNMVFSGKKISIETDDMELRDIFKLISEEGGVNLVITDDVKGKMSVKLRQVPWDQALVMVMRAKKLGYTRTGNVLRIASVSDIRAEEDESVKIATAKRTVAPLRVKLIPISYAKIEDLEKQVKPFLSPRGTVVVDARTSALVVSDIDENVERVVKLIQSIDISPQQVLIEGKIIEAADSFQRQIGIQWNSLGRPGSVGSGSYGDIRASGGMNVTVGSVAGQTASMNFSLGTMDILGDLSAFLTLKETEGSVKVLSSPRVVTLHNEVAEISQISELPIITSVPSSGGVAIPTVTFKQIKLKLNVTPNITNDGGVIMLVDVSREFPGEIVSKETQARPINSRSAKTKVLVRNGQTAVIGGIYQSDTTESEGRVPWLASIPVVGWLFKSKAKTTDKNELLIFITPRILGQLDAQTIPRGEPSAPGGGGDL